jgi:hypothetical protein
VNEKAWNSALTEAGPQGTIFQSTFWAQYLKRTFADRPIYITSLDRKGNIQGQLLAVESCFANHPICNRLRLQGLFFNNLYRKVVSPVLHKELPFIFWENGPIALPRAMDGEKTLLCRKLTCEILEKIIERTQKRGCYEIKFARPAFFNDHSDLFLSFGFWKKRMGTILINIEQDPEVLWPRIEKSARKNIDKLEQDAEIVEVSKEDDLREFHKMHEETTKRTNTKTYPFSYFRSLWSNFSKDRKIIVFILRMKDKPMGGSLSLLFNGLISEYAIVESDYARSMKFYPGDLLKWNTMKWGHEKGFKYFDVSGVELYKIDAGDQKARNIFRYKSKWGGQLVEFNDYGRIFPSKRRITSLLKRCLEDSMN